MKNEDLQKIINVLLLLISVSIIISSSTLYAESVSEYWDRYFHQNIINIRSINGKLYAYIVLLFNENPHFVNLIQEDSIPTKMIQKEGFHLSEYNNYLYSVRDPEIKELANVLLNIFLYPERFDKKFLNSVQNDLAKHNVILRFSKEKSKGTEKVVLDYCIFGKKELIKIVHPLFNIKEKIYNIQPFIYYDEFSTSNSTFYFDMIYINPEEVHNDYIIAKRILSGKSVDSMFFVGARVNDNIKYCIKHAFKKSKSIKSDILKMFKVHELTHKILNNHYNYFDQVTGEELAFTSTIYSNPYLGLSVLYCYLNYNPINPHRIAVINYIRFIANRTGRLEIIDDPSIIKYLPISEIKRLTKEHFDSIVKNLTQLN